MIPLLVPIGLGLIGGYLTKESDHEMFAKGGVIEVVAKDSRGAFRKRDYDGMTEKEVIDWWTSRGFKLSKSTQEYKLKPFTFYINKIGFAKGGKIGKSKAIDLLTKHIKYKFVNTDMGSGWKFTLYAPFSTSGYGADILDQKMYIDIFDGDDYEEWKQDMWDYGFNQFKEKVIPEYLDLYIEELQKDKDYAKGGGVGGAIVLGSKVKIVKNLEDYKGYKGEILEVVGYDDMGYYNLEGNGKDFYVSGKEIKLVESGSGEIEKRLSDEKKIIKKNIAAMKKGFPKGN